MPSGQFRCPDWSADIGSMDMKRAWNTTLKWVAALAVVAYMMWRTYTGDGWVFPFSYADLGFHELGHMLTMFWAPRPLVAFAGSALQVLVPVGLAAYFWFRRHEILATSLMIAWAGGSLNNVSIYIYDATRRVLPLLGSQDGHDWAYLLGPGVLDSLAHTDAIAYSVRAASVGLFLGAIALVGYGFAQPRIARHKAEQLEERQATLPVRESRSRPPEHGTASAGDPTGVFVADPSADHERSAPLA